MEEMFRLMPQVEWRRYYRPHRYFKAPKHPGGKRMLWEWGAGGLDVFHGLNQRLPARMRAPSVATFHDLFVMTGEYSSPEFRARFQVQAMEAAARADRIIAVSDFTARQVCNLLGYPPERIRVVPHGVDLPLSAPDPVRRKKAVLTVGALQVRKNTVRLLQAFSAMPDDWELWLVGSVGYGGEEAVRLAAAMPRVKVFGYVSDEELANLYREASIFAFPSLDEGFGIPVLEAMAYGLPVLTSNGSALVEVASNAAILVDPLRVEAIRDGLLALTKPETALHYQALGLHRAAMFPWSAAAALTIEIYRELIADRRR
jgi:glycosyltransferase involved in cell wall biosynthesis